MDVTEFTDSAWCNSGNNCIECRSDGEIHDNIMAKWPDLVCPLGISLNPESLPTKKIESRKLKWLDKNKPVIKNGKIIPRTLRKPCKHAVIGDTLAFKNKPCKGKIVTCTKDGGCVVVYESICNKDKCKWYEEKEL